MRGYRKVMIAVLVIAVAALVPLNEFQARVLEAVTWATLSTNAAVHVGGQIAEAIGKRIGSGGRDPALATGSAEVQPAAGEGGEGNQNIPRPTRG